MNILNYSVVGRSSSGLFRVRAVFSVFDKEVHALVDNDKNVYYKASDILELAGYKPTYTSFLHRYTTPGNLKHLPFESFFSNRLSYGLTVEGSLEILNMSKNHVSNAVRMHITQIGKRLKMEVEQ